MKLRHFTIALAAGALVAVLGLPDIADAGGHGGGHGGGRGGGFGGGRGFGGGHMGGAMGMRGMGGMGMRGMGGPGMGHMGMRNMGPTGMRGMNYGHRGPMGIHSGSGARIYGVPHGGRFNGQRFQTLNGHPGNRFNNRYFPGHIRAPLAAGAAVGAAGVAGAAALHGRPFAGNNFQRFAANPALRQAAFTRQNAFFNNRFGYNGFGRYPNRWYNWSGRWYGYRWWGPVFWPYWFGDYFSYAFWPYDYYDNYWGYGPDAIVWGAFWPYGEYASDNSCADASACSGDIYRPYKTAAPVAPDPAVGVDTCAGFAPGVSDLPIQQLDTIVDATEEQRAAFSDLKAASVKAADILKQSCSSETPLTPPARLDAMQRRLTTMAEANDVVRVPLVRLYGLFSDEQKQRLATLSEPTAKRAQTARAKEMNIAELCTSQASFTNVPAEQIASSIQLTDSQRQELDKLKAASAQASESLKGGCPATVPDTIEGRLDAAQQRVTTLITAVDTVRPAVRDFYASLTDEQKAALSVLPAEKRAANNRG